MLEWKRLQLQRQIKWRMKEKVMYRFSLSIVRAHLLSFCECRITSALSSGCVSFAPWTLAKHFHCTASIIPWCKRRRHQKLGWFRVTKITQSTHFRLTISHSEAHSCVSVTAVRQRKGVWHAMPLHHHTPTWSPAPHRSSKVYVTLVFT